MAYPTVSAPYGLQPINRVDGMPYAGATRQYPIDATQGNIFNGDLVNLVGGKIVKWQNIVGGAARPLGVFVGAQYTNSMGQTVQGQMFPAGSANGVAYVVVDGQAAFKVVVAQENPSGGGAVVIGAAYSVVGANMDITVGTGNTITGDSGTFVTYGSQAGGGTSTFLPVKVIDVVPASATVTDGGTGPTTTYPELIVKINVSQFDDAQGVVAGA